MIGRKREEYTGRRYGRLIIQSVDYSNSRKPIALCLCDCGNNKLLSLNSIRKGSTTSCGCYRKEIRKTQKYNSLPEGDAMRNGLIHDYRYNAISRGLVFDLNAEECEALFKGSCHYCGCKPSREKKRGNSIPYLYNGIDRKDNTLGYFPENVVSCCTMCNFKKGNQSYDEFVYWVSKVYNHCEALRV